MNNERTCEMTNVASRNHRQSVEACLVGIKKDFGSNEQVATKEDQWLDLL
jgi:hypothetical protein